MLVIDLISYIKLEGAVRSLFLSQQMAKLMSLAIMTTRQEIMIGDI